MKCWCDEIIDYDCIECESEKKWLRLPEADKLTLKAYALDLDRGQSNMSTAKKIMDKNICVSMIPRKYFARNN